MQVRIADAATTRELRRAVLRPSWAPGTPLAGDGEPAAIHLAAVDDDGTVVGACVLLDRGGEWQLRGMATTPERRGQGIGAAVLAAALELVAERGGRQLWCNARTGARDFYARHGFTVDGDEFVQAETGLPHVRMYRTIGR